MSRYIKKVLSKVKVLSETNKTNPILNNWKRATPKPLIYSFIASYYLQMVYLSRLNPCNADGVP